MVSELQALKIRQVVTELRKLDRLLEEQQWQRHVAFLRSVRKNFDARDLLRLANELRIQTQFFELHLSGLIGVGRSYSAAAGSRPPQQVALGRYTPSMGGEIAEFRALSSRLSRQLESLSTEISSFTTEANAALNEPGRYGDAAIPNPVNDLFGFIQMVLDLMNRIRLL